MGGLRRKNRRLGEIAFFGFHAHYTIMTYFQMLWVIVVGALFLLCACGGNSQDENPAVSDVPAEVEPEPERVPDYVGNPADEASSIFERDQILTFELSTSAENLEFLNSDPVAEEYVPATLQFEGEQYAEVGLRYKGSIGSFIGCTEFFGFPPSGAKTCVKLSMKVKINHTDSNLKFHGLKKLQFHAMNTDESLMRERLSYYLFRAMGIPAPRTVPVRLFVNGSLQGLFLLVEQVDGRFTRSRFGDGGKGNLYKEVWPKHADSSAYLSALKTNENDNPSVEKMERLTQALQGADSEEALVAISDAWIDREYILNYLAVDRAIQNDDGAMHWYCDGPNGGMELCDPHNFYWYEDEASDRMWLIPWDTDLTFRRDHITTIPAVWNDHEPRCESRGAPLGYFIPPSCDPLISAWASFNDDYASALQAFLDGPFAAGNVAALLDTWQSQIETVVTEAHEIDGEHLAPDEWIDALGALKLDTYRRRESLQESISAGDP